MPLRKIQLSDRTLDVVENALTMWGEHCGDPVQEDETSDALAIIRTKRQRADDPQAQLDEIHRERDWTRRALAVEDPEPTPEPEPSELDQLATLIREALDKVAAVNYRRGRFSAGADISAESLREPQAAADAATIAMWRAFYDVGSKLGEAGQ